MDQLFRIKNLQKKLTALDVLFAIEKHTKLKGLAVEIEKISASRDSRSLSAVPSEITMDEVVRLNEMQRSNMVHPYTCGNRDNHPVFDGDRGVLVATIHGWICPFCDYKQPIKRGIAG